MNPFWRWLNPAGVERSPEPALSFLVLAPQTWRESARRSATKVLADEYFNDDLGDDMKIARRVVPTLFD